MPKYLPARINVTHSTSGTPLMLPYIILLFLVACSLGVSAQTFTFTNCGATGYNGPTQAQINSAYASTSLAGQVTSQAGIQLWTVPSTGLYQIEAWGAQGAHATAGGGYGAYVLGEFNLLAGQVIMVLVGQEGDAGNGPRSGGGGGTYVVKYAAVPSTLTNSDIYVIAGGGGSSNPQVDPNSHGSASSNGNPSTLTGTAPGINGNGGTITVSHYISCGAGFFTNGQRGTTGGILESQSFINGGVGSYNITANDFWFGGFGGGGGARGTATTGRNGGGGGYSGGAGGESYGGGGGSYNSGTNQVNQAGVNAGHGKVVISSLSSGGMNDVGVIAIDSPATICEGTHNVVATISNFGANQVDNVTVQWSVDGMAQAPVAYSGLLDTFGGVGSITAQVLLGSNTFGGGTYAIKAWTSMPNGLADTVNQNDTMGVNKVAHPNPTVNLGNDTVFCQGATAFMILNAGNPGSTYLWHDNAAGSQFIVTGPGTYWVRVTSAQGCVGRDTFVATTAPSPVVSIHDTTVCEGELIVLDAGNPGSTYLWSDNSTTQTLTVTATGFYQVTVTNQDGCKDDDLAVVTIHPNPVVDLGNDTLTHSGAQVTLDAGNPGATYLWNTGATTRTITVSAHGTYSVTVTDANGCEGTATFINEPNSIHTVVELGKWSVFPNPTDGDTHIRLELNRGGKVVIELYDPSGRRVWGQAYTNATGTETISIPMQGLAQGMYLLRVRLDGQLIGTSVVGKL